jgi:hypothetical protein
LIDGAGAAANRTFPACTVNEADLVLMSLYMQTAYILFLYCLGRDANFIEDVENTVLQEIVTSRFAT